MQIHVMWLLADLAEGFYVLGLLLLYSGGQP